MLVTVAICTLNRAESLRRTLDTLAAMQVPSDLGWEVVVVNNDCTDHTDEIIASFVGRLPIRRELEPQRGLSRARNRAIDAANGQYIVWTDDDVIVDPGWLNAYVEAFRRWPEAVVFGGAIIPRYDCFWPAAKGLGICAEPARIDDDVNVGPNNVFAVGGINSAVACTRKSSLWLEFAPNW